MKLITAVVDPRALDDVRAALETFGIDRLTVSPASGPTQPTKALYRGIEYLIDLGPLNRVEVVCDLFDAEAISGALVAASRCGGRSGGTVWISEVDHVTSFSPT